MVSKSTKRAICSVADCGGLVHCRNMCNRHYRALYLKQTKLKPCACGCGGLTAYTLVSGHNTRLLDSSEQSRRGRMNTGEAMRDSGEGKGYRKYRGRHEHRVVAEAMLGRPLLENEIVHHKDGNKRNNHPSNLEVMTQSEHARLHAADMFVGRFFSQ